MLKSNFYHRKGVVTLAWLALLVCLVSASMIHHHENGLHLAHACQLCVIEEITTHGAAVCVAVSSTIERGIFTADSMLLPITTGAFYFTRDIRGSPHLS